MMQSSSKPSSHKKSKDPNKPAMKLRIWRLERQKKCLVWQKKYLQAVLQNVENEGGITTEHCRNNSCNCNNTSSSESHSLVSVNNGEAGSNKIATTTETEVLSHQHSTAKATAVDKKP